MDDDDLIERLDKLARQLPFSREVRLVEEARDELKRLREELNETQQALAVLTQTSPKEAITEARRRLQV